MDKPQGLMAMTNVNGILPVMNNAMLEAERAQAVSAANTQPVIDNLASYVRSLWTPAQQAKQDVELRMLKNLRQRRGEYEPEILQEIRKTSGSEVFMMLTSNKCRTATAWLKDTLLGAKDQKPWTLSATADPELNPTDSEKIVTQATQEALQLEQMMGVQITPQTMYSIVDSVKGKLLEARKNEARRKLSRMENKMEDQLQEGGFLKALEDCVDDITTFPTAIMKGPVIRKRPRLNWVQDGTGQYTAEVEQKMVEEWERVDPFNLYPSPQASGVNDGYLFERHRLSRLELESMIGVEGYSEEAIREVLAQYGRGGLRDWLSIDNEKAVAEGKTSTYVYDNPEGLIDALQFWGTVQGSRLIEWGMSGEEVPDTEREYHCEIWLIGTKVIKAVLNYNPLGFKPYYIASYERIPGSFWGNSICDLIADCQTLCNAAARALANNMAIASGPQVDVNTDRLAEGEDITEMYPWKIWQTKSDQFGTTTQPAINFFQPNIMAAELMGIYERFSVLADEYSSIPRYMTGDASTGGAGRTASGMSMLMSNAGKGIKNVVANIDAGIIAPSIYNLYIHNMKYSDDAELKGDINVVARGANSLVVKEQAQVRRNEFLQIALNSPVAQEVIGVNGVASLLREGAKSLDMDTSDIIPSKEALQASQVQQTLAARQQMQTQAMGGSQLMDGTQTTNNFKPMGT